jgi:Protein of unknown function (DUF3667)
MSHKKAKHHPNCLNCHLPLSEFDSFCPNCGQKPTDGKVTMHDLFHEFVHTTLHLDGKFFTTLRHIFVPAKLTTEFFKGHHKRYAHPIQLYLVLGALTGAVIVGATHKAEDSARESQEKNRLKAQYTQWMKEVKATTKKIGLSNAVEKQLLDSLNIQLSTEMGTNPVLNLDWQVANATFDLFENEKELRAKYKDETQPSPVQIIDNQTIKFEGQTIDLRSTTDSSKKEPVVKIELNFKTDDVSVKQLKDSSQPKIDAKNRKITPTAIKGVKSNWDEEDIDEQKEEIKGLITARQQLDKMGLNMVFSNNNDSTSLNQLSAITGNRKDARLKFANTDLYNLSVEELVEMAEPKTFFEKIYFKQAIKAKKAGDTMLHNFFGKLLWIVTISIPIVALWFQLIYRRQKRYYVEHVLLLVHSSLALFIGIIVMINIPKAYDDWNGWVVLWLIVHFFLAMKFYYQQGWRKTLLKYFSVGFVYIIVASIIATLLFVLSFFLF